METGIPDEELTADFHAPEGREGSGLAAFGEGGGSWSTATHDVTALIPPKSHDVAGFQFLIQGPL